MEEEGNLPRSTRALMVLNVPNHFHPPFYPMPGKPGNYIHAPCNETHGGKPGSGDNLPWARSTSQCQQMTGPNDLLQLLGQGHMVLNCCNPCVLHQQV